MSINLMAFLQEVVYLYLDEYESLGTHQIALYVNDKNVTYFQYLKNITTNIYRIQAYDSIMCGFFCIGFIDFMLKGRVQKFILS